MNKNLSPKLILYYDFFKKTQGEWQIVFGITAIIYLIGCLVLVINQKDEKPLDWAVKEKNTSKTNEENVPLQNK